MSQNILTCDIIGKLLIIVCFEYRYNVSYW